MSENLVLCASASIHNKPIVILYALIITELVLYFPVKLSTIQNDMIRFVMVGFYVFKTTRAHIGPIDCLKNDKTNDVNRK